MARISSWQKVLAYSGYFNETLEESYYHLIDMGEISESYSLLARCKKIDAK